MAKAQDVAKKEESLGNKKEKEFKQSISLCPIALVFGIYSMNYERLLNEHSGIMIRGDYESIPGTYTSAKINSSAKAGIINYRYHIKGGLKSMFVGAFARYRAFEGDGNYEGEAFDFTLKESTIGVNIGKKFIMKNGFTATLAVGYGHFMDKTTISSSSAGVHESIKQYKKDYGLYNGLLGEVSIGYSF